MNEPVSSERARDRPDHDRIRPGGGSGTPKPSRVRTRRARRSLPLAGALLVALLLGGLAAASAFGGAGATPSASPRPASAPPVEYLNVSATSQFQFVPANPTVTAGDSIHFTLVQDASFPHTFVLSPVANYTIPTSTNSTDLSAYFRAHTPLVNLSVAGTPGATNSTVFLAPPIGVYEFVCVIPGHFQAGMYGFLHSTNGTATTPPPSGSAPDYLLYAGIGAAIVIVIALAVVAGRRARRPGAGPPP